MTHTTKNTLIALLITVILAPGLYFGVVPPSVAEAQGADTHVVVVSGINADGSFQDTVKTLLEDIVPEVTEENVVEVIGSNNAFEIEAQIEAEVNSIKDQYGEDADILVVSASLGAIAAYNADLGDDVKTILYDPPYAADKIPFFDIPAPGIVGYVSDNVAAIQQAEENGIANAPGVIILTNGTAEGDEHTKYTYDPAELYIALKEHFVDTSGSSIQPGDYDYAWDDPSVIDSSSVQPGDYNYPDGGTEEGQSPDVMFPGGDVSIGGLEFNVNEVFENLLVSTIAGVVPGGGIIYNGIESTIENVAHELTMIWAKDEEGYGGYGDGLEPSTTSKIVDTLGTILSIPIQTIYYGLIQPIEKLVGAIASGDEEVISEVIENSSVQPDDYNYPDGDEVQYPTYNSNIEESDLHPEVGATLWSPTQGYLRYDGNGIYTPITAEEYESGAGTPPVNTGTGEWTHLGNGVWENSETGALHVDSSSVQPDDYNYPQEGDGGMGDGSDFGTGASFVNDTDTGYPNTTAGSGYTDIGVGYLEQVGDYTYLGWDPREKKHVWQHVSAYPIQQHLGPAPPGGFPPAGDSDSDSDGDTPDNDEQVTDGGNPDGTHPDGIDPDNPGEEGDSDSDGDGDIGDTPDNDVNADAGEGIGVSTGPEDDPNDEGWDL